jgi:hypothetical protein
MIMIKTSRSTTARNGSVGGERNDAERMGADGTFNRKELTDQDEERCLYVDEKSRGRETSLRA